MDPVYIGSMRPGLARVHRPGFKGAEYFPLGYDEGTVSEGWITTSEVVTVLGYEPAEEGVSDYVYCLVLRSTGDIVTVRADDLREVDL